MKYSVTVTFLLLVSLMMLFFFRQGITDEWKIIESCQKVSHLEVLTCRDLTESYDVNQ